MPYRSMGERGIDKIKDLDIAMIAPSHGPMHRNPSRILEVYKKWTEGETRNKVIVVYASMWKSTEKMILQLVARASV